ncbi:hypothetical protein FGO68_gene6911 [Halteria grandinella]|uniref:RING-type domain-containing protein n=1 Tax=Halteria grandinella TaxID=5974 RepID=A0A8J8NN55_HALGN|nr:hypothetical protein FGO68_gene6911 [Halteria grandinella]
MLDQVMKRNAYLFTPDYKIELIQQLEMEPLMQDPQNDPIKVPEEKKEEQITIRERIDQQQPIQKNADLNMNCLRCGNYFNTSYRQIVQLTCGHLACQSCARSQYPCIHKDKIGCKQSAAEKQKHDSQQFVNRFLQDHFKGQDALKCLTHPKHKVKLYSESNGTFYCYKCLLTNRADESIVQISEMKLLVKLQIPESFKQLQENYEELMTEYSLIGEQHIQDCVFGLKQQTDHQVASLLELIEECKLQQYLAIEEAAKDAQEQLKSSIQYNLQEHKQVWAQLQINSNNIQSENLLQSDLQSISAYVEKERDTLSILQLRTNDTIFENLDQELKARFNRQWKIVLKMHQLQQHCNLVH